MFDKKFLDYISSFNKSKGNYTKEEIYKIGLEHKKLPLNEKNWTELNNILGAAKNGNALRVSINYTKKKHLDPSYVVTKNEQDLNSNLDEVDINDLIQKKEELYIQQVKTADLVNKYKKLLREEARVQAFKENLIQSMKTLPPLDIEAKHEPIAMFKSGRRFNNEAVLMLSDFHIGVTCDNFYNTFNYEIACKRVGKLVNDVKEYCLREDVKTLHILNLGDMIQGLIHTNARIEQEFDITTQIMVASEILSRILNEFAKFLPKVTYRSCLDNHSRSVANLHEHIEAENFSNIIDWFLKERLKDTGIEFIEDNIDRGIGMFKLENGKNIVFAHGHRDSTNTALQHFIGATEEFVHYVLLAHEHSEKVKIYQNVRVITNGSLVGTESYALSRRLFNKPSQTLLIFDDKNLLNFSIELDVQE